MTLKSIKADRLITIVASVIAILAIEAAQANAAISNSVSKPPPPGWLWTDDGIPPPLQRIPGFVLKTPDEVVSVFENCGKSTNAHFPYLPKPVAFLAVNSRVGLETYGKMFYALSEDMPRKGPLDELPDRFVLAVNGVMTMMPVTQGEVEAQLVRALSNPMTVEVVVLRTNWYTPGTAERLAQRVADQAPIR